MIIVYVSLSKHQALDYCQLMHTQYVFIISAVKEEQFLHWRSRIQCVLSILPKIIHLNVPAAALILIMWILEAGIQHCSHKWTKLAWKENYHRGEDSNKRPEGARQDHHAKLWRALIYLELSFVINISYLQQFPTLWSSVDGEQMLKRGSRGILAVKLQW